MSLDVDLAARMDASLVAYWGAYGLAPGSVHREFAGGVFSYTPIPLSLFNTVMLTGRDPGSIELAIELAATCIAEQGRPVLWRLSATAATDAVREQLGRAGLAPNGRQPAMVMELADLPHPPRIDGLTIHPVEGASGRDDWARLTCRAFELPPDCHDVMGRCEAAIPEAMFPHQPRYVGCLDGKPVAVSSLVMTGGMAGIYAVATLPEARTRGVGTAMTLHAVAEGKRRGAGLAVLQASEMGKPVYERIGFSTVYDYELYLQT